MNRDQKEMFLAAIAQHGKCRVTVSGTSMWPFVRTGDEVTVVRIQERPALGEVVAFFVQDQMILHRVIWNGARTGLWVRGDAMPFSCVKIRREEVCGRATSVGDRSRVRDWWLKPPLGFAAVAAGFVLQALFAGRQLVGRAVPKSF